MVVVAGPAGGMVVVASGGGAMMMVWEGFFVLQGVKDVFFDIPNRLICCLDLYSVYCFRRLVYISGHFRQAIGVSRRCVLKTKA